MKITKRQLRRIIKEETARLNEVEDPKWKKGHGGGAKARPGPIVFTPEQRQAKEAAVTLIEEQLNGLFDVGLPNEELIAILEQVIKDINSGFVGEPT